MEEALVRQRYKIIRILCKEEHYTCAQAVDILDREKPSCLLNLYDGQLLADCLPRFQSLEGREGFRDMFVERGSLAAIFDDESGTPIDSVFYKGDRHTRQDRLEWADALMQKVLSLADADPLIGCSVLLSENVLTRPDEKQIRLRFAIYPMDGANPREAALLAGDQLKKILRTRWESPAEELDFWDELDRGEYPNIVKLYALWTQNRESIGAGYEKLERKSFIGRNLTLLWQKIRHRLKQRG